MSSWIPHLPKENVLERESSKKNKREKGKYGKSEV